MDKTLLGAPGASDPLDHFTDAQWYCYQAHQSVYFAAFLSDTPSQQDIVDFVKKLVAHAPQIAAGFPQGPTGQLLADDMIARLIDYQQVDGLEDYPNEWDTSAEPLYEHPDLPMLRIRVRVRKSGLDDGGRGAALLVLSTHALFEGADSADLSRSRNAAREDAKDAAPGLPWWRRMILTIGAAFLAPVQIGLAFFLAPKTVTHDFAALTISRARLRKAAAKYGVGQRAFMFALVALAINGKDRIFSKRHIFVTYTEMDDVNGMRGNDDYFRFRMMETKFPLSDDFGTFAHTVQNNIAALENANPLTSQAFINALFRTHRWMKTHLPFLYFSRLFRFTGFYHLDLSMVPPHRLGGDLVENMLEPVYAGTQHPGLNACIFVPQRHWVTFNFNLPAHLITRVPDVLTLLDAVDPPDLPQ